MKVCLVACLGVEGLLKCVFLVLYEHLSGRVRQLVIKKSLWVVLSVVQG